MHHANMVIDVVAGLQKALQQDKYQRETLSVMQVYVNHVSNAVKNTQQQLATQLQKMQSMMHALQTQFTAVPHGTRQDYGGRQYYGGRGYHENQSSYRG